MPQYSDLSVIEIRGWGVARVGTLVGYVGETVGLAVNLIQHVASIAPRTPGCPGKSKYELLGSAPAMPPVPKAHPYAFCSWAAVVVQNAFSIDLFLFENSIWQAIFGENFQAIPHK